MRRTPIRMKLGVALSVPLLGLLGITVAEMADTTREVDAVRQQTDLARASIGPAGLITSLQNERTWAVTELIGQETAIQPPVVGYDESRAATDQAIAAFRETLGKDDRPEVAAYGEPLAGLAELEALRSTIDASTTDRELSNVEFSTEIYLGYSEMIRPFIDANAKVALAIDDAQLRQVTSLVNITTGQVETVADLARTTVTEVVPGGRPEAARDIAAIAKDKADFDQANDTLLQAGAPVDQVVEGAYPEDMVAGLTDHVDATIAGDEIDMGTIMTTLDVPDEASFTGLRNALIEALNDRADELNDAAQSRERLLIALAAITVVSAIVLSWLVTRSITRPLRALTLQAKEMADRRLPNAVIDILETPLGENIAVPHVDPVRVTTSDEVADVADALNTVQDTALDLAVEQAVLRRNIADSFVNLGRRNQNLLGRQLDFITELESSETDADALSNLFRLDHLATRMRRNAESLLVLAGIEPPRQWAAPVRLTDVIRAALGEVEDYRRVTVRGVEPATIIGSAAADLAHLMAELIENALVFSPPDQTVDIRGRNRNQGGYTLAIIDVGLGMPAADLAAANRRLAGAESFTIAPSKYLGHYVAGNLAARHDIAVRLDPSPDGGITATITVPTSLMTDDEAVGAPVTPPRGHRMAPAYVRKRTGTPEPSHRTPAARADGGGAQPTSPAPGGGFPAQSPPRSDPRGTPAVRLPAAGAPPAGQRLHRGAPPGDTAPSNLGPPAPPSAPGPLTGGPRRRPAGDPAAAGTTPGGLARRTAAPRDHGAPPPLDDTLLAALGRVSPARPTAPPPAPAPAPAPGPSARPGPEPRHPEGPGPVPRAAWTAPDAHRAPRRSSGPPRNAPDATPGPGGSPGAPPDALARRVRGAQLPRTTVTTLQRGASTSAPAPTGDRPTRAPHGATDVRALLTQFTAGVQRGLAESGGRTPQASGPSTIIDPTGRSADHR